MVASMATKLTHKQIEALIDLNEGDWRYGIQVRNRRALPSLRKRGLVLQHYGIDAADEWKITDAGRVAINGQATIQHLRR